MSSKKGMYIFIILGLLLGVTLDRLIHTANQHFFYYAFSSLFCLLYALSYNQKESIRLVGSSLILAFLLSIPLFAINGERWDFYNDHTAIFLFTFPFFAYVGHSFHYALHHDNRLRISYHSLFEAVWISIPLIFSAFVFSSIANGLMVLAAYIFKSVGSSYLWDLLYSNSHFLFISNTVLFFIGLGIGQEHINIITNMRLIFLKMMYYLFPVLAFISVCYSMLYLINAFKGGVSPSDPLAILIPLNILGILFFNAYFQDGSVKEGFPSWLRIFLRLYRVVLFALVAIMNYVVFRDYLVDINAYISLISALMFSGTYALSAFLSKTCADKTIKRGNVITAAFFMSALFLCNLPYMPLNYVIGQGHTQSSAP